ncbi:MAG TPA: NAD(P)/FAD-dependent oxidoreductase [Candidatus Eisenbacteria bacterium]|nr:NAD(P)/FAD-dependent oxidoreductase [Candidatus Eisenbacteria bacterium]
MGRPERVEALIVGAGVAGIAAGIWLKDLGVEALILEESLQPGGQLHEIHAPTINYLLARGWDGPRLAAGVVADARAWELRIEVGAPVESISVRGRSVVRSGRRFVGKTLIIATGLRRRALGVPGERELAGHGVSVSANLDRTAYAGRPVVVVGGGTAGVEDALLCAETGSPVTLLHHTARFRARSDFLERARKNRGIRIVTGARVTRILGNGAVSGVEYRARGIARPRVLPADAVFVRIGWEPRSELLRQQLRMDRSGYVVAGVGGVTSVPRVYAIGDVCSPRCPSIANAEGQGSATAWEIARLFKRIG